MLTNARSLFPKFESLIDNMKELDTDICFVTETWLSDGPTLDKDLDDLLLGAGIGLITLNREPGLNGVSHGDVAIGYPSATVTLKRIPAKNTRF